MGPALRYAAGDNNLAPMTDTLSTEQFEAEVAVHRQLLFKLAMVQLQDTAAADDVVQETILAALLGRAKFRYQSSIKTWLISIMRYKVVDAIRLRHRYVLAPQAGGVDDDAIFESLFDSMVAGEMQRMPGAIPSRRPSESPFSRFSRRV